MKCHEILRRRFVNGYIYDYATESALSTGAFVLSLGLALSAWGYLDVAFECTTLTDSKSLVVVWMLLLVIALSSPVLGLFVVLAINHIARANLKELGWHGERISGFSHSSVWLPPLAAIFLGVVSKLCLSFIGGMIKDSVDVLYLCSAIDEDNGTTRNQGEDEFDSIVKNMPGFIVAVPVHNVDLEAPIATEVVIASAIAQPESEINVPSLGNRKDNAGSGDWVVGVNHVTNGNKR